MVNACLLFWPIQRWCNCNPDFSEILKKDKGADSTTGPKNATNNRSSFDELIAEWESDFWSTHDESSVGQYGRQISLISEADRQQARLLCWEDCKGMITSYAGKSCISCGKAGSLKRSNTLRHYHWCMPDASHYFHAIHPQFKDKTLAELKAVKGRRMTSHVTHWVMLETDS